MNRSRAITQKILSLVALPFLLALVTNPERFTGYAAIRMEPLTRPLHWLGIDSTWGYFLEPEIGVLSLQYQMISKDRNGSEIIKSGELPEKEELTEGWEDWTRDFLESEYFQEQSIRQRLFAHYLCEKYPGYEKVKMNFLAKPVTALVPGGFVENFSIDMSKRIEWSAECTCSVK